MSAAIGKILREAREARELSIEDVAQTTHIRAHYLQAMEAGNFSSLPSPVQIRGFLRVYASYLDLDTRPLLEALERGPIPTLITPSEPSPSETEETEQPIEGPQTSFAEIGERLRDRREVLGLSLEDVERHTHLRTHYLEALEAGALERLPSPVQGRGMLKNYADFVGLDSDELLLRFADGLQARLDEKRGETPKRQKQTPSRTPSRVRRIFSRDAILGGTVVALLIIFIAWGGFRVAAMRSSEAPEPTPPSIAEVLLPSPSATLEPTPTPTVPSPVEESEASTPDIVQPPGEGTVEVTVTPAAGLQGAIQVQIVVYQRAWMRVTADEEIIFEGRVLPGSAHAFAGEEQIELLTGNGAALQVFYNQQDLGVLGAFGEVVDLVMTLDGVQTPTPTPAPTFTETPRTTPGPTTSP
jgi:cytoskeleton protein RodZ